MVNSADRRTICCAVFSPTSQWPHPLSHGSCNKTNTTWFYRENMAHYYPSVLIPRPSSLTPRYQYLGKVLCHIFPLTMWHLYNILLILLFRGSVCVKCNESWCTQFNWFTVNKVHFYLVEVSTWFFLSNLGICCHLLYSLCVC